MLAQRKRSQGFSLMELMIVVVITGVLAAIAIPTFISYVQKSRTSEATQFLGVIKLKQEARRAEFGGYLVCDGADNMGEFVYVPGGKATMKNGVSRNINSQCFTDLGARPDGPVRFGYAWIAGPPAVPNDVAGALGLTAAEFDHYFVAHAISDLDGDGIAVVFELSNFTRNIFIMDDVNSRPLAAGWE
jgi:prepilin-type N-terminal cleavage/methylation domain-containing protein